MILPFKPYFVDPILEGTKIHSLREDKTNRWKPGKLIHFATGIRTKNYNCFKSDICKHTEQINIFWHGTIVHFYINDFSIVCFNTAGAWSNFDGNGFAQLEVLAKNDGFKSVSDFLSWFDKNFTGKIIHWTNYSYTPF